MAEEQVESQSHEVENWEYKQRKDEATEDGISMKRKRCKIHETMNKKLRNGILEKSRQKQSG